MHRWMKISKADKSPVFKKDKRLDKENYIPVSILFYMLKVFKKGSSTKKLRN